MGLFFFPRGWDEVVRDARSVMGGGDLLPPWEVVRGAELGGGDGQSHLWCLLSSCSAGTLLCVCQARAACPAPVAHGAGGPWRWPGLVGDLSPVFDPGFGSLWHRGEKLGERPSLVSRKPRFRELNRQVGVPRRRWELGVLRQARGSAAPRWKSRRESWGAAERASGGERARSPRARGLPRSRRRPSRCPAVSGGDEDLIRKYVQMAERARPGERGRGRGERGSCGDRMGLTSRGGGSQSPRLFGSCWEGSVCQSCGSES